jgi:hypothetical protein
MPNIERIMQDDRQMRAMTGMNLKVFKALVPIFATAYQNATSQSKRWRMRSPGGGRKPKLSTIEDKLLYILVYAKCYPTFDVMGSMFDLSRASAHEWVHKLMPILEQALSDSGALPARSIESMAEFAEECPELNKVILDGMERPIQRPQDAKRQKENYSGKKTPYAEAHHSQHP